MRVELRLDAGKPIVGCRFQMVNIMTKGINKKDLAAHEWLFPLELPSAERDLLNASDQLYSNSIISVQDAADWEGTHKELLGVKRVDDELSKAVSAACSFLLKEIHNPRASMVGLFVGGLQAFLKNHPGFYHLYLDDPQFHDAEKVWTSMRASQDVEAIPVDCFGSKMERSEPENEVHKIHIRTLVDALDFETELTECFDLRYVDREIEDAIRPAATWAVDQIANNPKATVCGIVIGSLRELMRNHRAFYGYVRGPRRPYPRRVEEIEADIADERIRGTRRLEFELEWARELRAKAAAVVEQAS